MSTRATSPSKKKSSSSDNNNGKPPQAVRFGRRTSSGRIVGLSQDDDLDMSAENATGDSMNYTVMMPPTPDNQPGVEQGAGGTSSSSRVRMESQQRNGDQTNIGRLSGKLDRRVSVLKSNSKSMLMRSQTGDFDHNRWLFETKGKYGIGTACWKEEEAYDATSAGMTMDDFTDKPWKPLTRKINVPPAIISPYRLLVVIRLVALILFLSWRVQNPNEDALWLWGLSIVCEIWFAFSWLLDQLPKLNPINRAVDLAALKEKFEQPCPSNPQGRSDLPGVDIFVSTADPDKEPPLVTANTILSILAVEYPVEKIACYISDDGASMLTFEAMAEAVSFAELWVPFCRKHNIEPRNPDTYFNLKKDPTKDKKKEDFVKDRRWIKREYDEFKVRINGLPDAIKKRCDMLNSKDELQRNDSHTTTNTDNSNGETNTEKTEVQKATWMADGTQWPGTWYQKAPDHAKGDHAGILQIMSKIPEIDPVLGHYDEKKLDFTGVDIRLPMFVYVSREKRPGYDHNKKAGAMNALVRASAILSNGPFILNLDCDHYFYNSMAIREGMCYMMDRGGDRICYVQFPQRFEGIDPSDRYANHNTVFFDGNMRALDGLQGPVYVGTGCMFRRYALYGFDPPRAIEYTGIFGQHKQPTQSTVQEQSDQEEDSSDTQHLTSHPDLELPKKFGNSTVFTDSIPVAEFQGRPLADHVSVKNGRPPGALIHARWIYGSVTEDVVTGYRMHNRGWRSVYCITKRDAFRGSAPINLTDRLHQVLRWATGSVEIFFSRNNPMVATRRLKFLQRVAYLNVGIYPFTSIFLVVYCFLPALSLFSGQFIVQGLSIPFLSYLLTITVCLMLLSLLEVKWSGIGLEEWWRNEQFWVIGGTSAHFAAVLQGLLKVIAGIEISFTLTSKSAAEEEDDIYADLYVVKWTSLFCMPLTIMVINMVALVIGFSRTVYSVIPEWNKFLGGCFFSLWVLAHMYPFAKGLTGKRGRVPTIVWVWSGLVSITVSLLWITISPPQGSVSVSSGGVQM
ncbi:Cellulose synthase-like protein D1 [Bienertia sinuspersici]